MITRCANQECSRLFDYREGRYFRFQGNVAPGEVPANVHSVEHFWLCGSCSEAYTLEHQSYLPEIRAGETCPRINLNWGEAGHSESDRINAVRLISRSSKPVGVFEYLRNSIV